MKPSSQPRCQPSGVVRALSQPDFDYLRDLVRQQSAIVLESDKVYLAETRLLALAQSEGCATVSALVARLRAGTAYGLPQRVVEAMTTNETFFFRDGQPFEALRQFVLPDLVQRRSSERQLHIWCAACASGQEPYSVAILLREHFPLLGAWDAQLIASDLSVEMLNRARQGRYSQLEVNRGLSSRLLEKYFDQQGTDWLLRPEIRRMVNFWRINLIEPLPTLPMLDVILLRNVLIYMDVATRKDILVRVRRQLRSDGYLFLGGAETTLNLDEAFERVPFERAGCYRLRAT